MMTLILCVICYSFGYHRGAEQSPIPQMIKIDGLVSRRNESALAALSSIYVNSLHPTTNTLVQGGHVKY